MRGAAYCSEEHARLGRAAQVMQATPLRYPELFLAAGERTAESYWISLRLLQSLPHGAGDAFLQPRRWSTRTR